MRTAEEILRDKLGERRFLLSGGMAIEQIVEAMNEYAKQFNTTPNNILTDDYLEFENWKKENCCKVFDEWTFNLESTYKNPDKILYYTEEQLYEIFKTKK